MNRDMIKIWNNTVRENDTVYFLGDLDINPKRGFRDISMLLNGKKILISGNHDMTFRHTKEQTRPNNVEKVLNWGWSEVHQETMIRLSNGMLVKLAHLPYLDKQTSKIDLRYKDVRPIKGNEYVLIHGHQHARYVKLNNTIDVGFDGKLGLYSEDDIIKLINDKRNYIASRLTKFYNSKEQRVLGD